jgi:hypothetical protein
MHALQDDQPLRPLGARPAKKARKALYAKGDSVAIQCWGEGDDSDDEIDDDGDAGEVVYTGHVKEDGIFSHSRSCFTYKVQYFEAMTSNLGGCYKLWGKRAEFVCVDESDILGVVKWSKCAKKCKYHKALWVMTNGTRIRKY